jgi:putative hemolysin
VENATTGPAARAVPPSADGTGHETCLGRLGPLEVRLASGEDEVGAAQEIRYRIFRAERGSDSAGAYGGGVRDEDEFDALCDHLLVVDTATREGGRERIVGTYRLLPQERIGPGGRFYSEQEFEFARLVARHPGRRFLELGRSCVVPDYRSRRTVELLWQGVWAYCRRRDIDVMCGCASFPGVIPAAHAEPLSFLGHFHSAKGEWHISALPHRYRTMDLMPAEAVDERSAIAALPPLIKGYLRLGARFGDGCVIDREFGTTDVFVVLPVDTISERYVRYYGTEAERFAAR